MTTPRIISAIEYLDSDIVEEATEEIVKSTSILHSIKWKNAAACLCVIVSVFVLSLHVLADGNIKPYDVETYKETVEVINDNYGKWSETEPYDVAGYFSPDNNNYENPNVNISKRITLKKWKSKTWRIDLGGGWCGTNTAQDTVTIKIKNDGNNRIRYICEDITDHKELAVFTSQEDINRVLSNLNPAHQYEITVINIENRQLSYDVSIISYNSSSGEIVIY